MKREARRTRHDSTPEEEARLQRLREQISQELPDLIRTDQLRTKAAEEDTLSGSLRRAIHKHVLSLTQIAQQCGLNVEELDLFLTGEKELPSSAIDRLVDVVGCKLVSVEPVR